jgi:hypothetical protein
MFDFEILPGLPPNGPLAEAFPRMWGQGGREGYVVEIRPDGNATWIGNFRPGALAFSGAYRHPNGHDLLVVSGGQGYIVDPGTRESRDEIGGGAIERVWVLARGASLLLQHQGLFFELLGPRGTVWHTRRLSWDGFKNVALSQGRLAGQGWDAISGEWRDFAVDLDAGASQGGGYSGPDGEEHQRLAK